VPLAKLLAAELGVVTGIYLRIAPAAIPEVNQFKSLLFIPEVIPIEGALQLTVESAPAPSPSPVGISLRLDSAAGAAWSSVSVGKNGIRLAGVTYEGLVAATTTLLQGARCCWCTWCSWCWC